jgi:hypothetical protein
MTAVKTVLTTALATALLASSAVGQDKSDSVLESARRVRATEIEFRSALDRARKAGNLDKRSEYEELELAHALDQFLRDHVLAGEVLRGLLEKRARR